MVDFGIAYNHDRHRLLVRRLEQGMKQSKQYISCEEASGKLGEQYEGRLKQCSALGHVVDFDGSTPSIECVREGHEQWCRVV